MTFARTEEGLALRRFEMRCEVLMDKDKARLGSDELALAERDEASGSNPDVSKRAARPGGVS